MSPSRQSILILDFSYTLVVIIQGFIVRKLPHKEFSCWYVMPADRSSRHSWLYRVVFPIILIVLRDQNPKQLINAPY